MCVHVRGGGMHVFANASAHYVGMFFRAQFYVTPVCKGMRFSLPLATNM